MDAPGRHGYRSAMAFACPICKCINFKEVVVPRGEGTTARHCCGCSVMFHNPAKFSVDRDEKARRELAKSNQGNPICE
jgi:hypothetical protein